MNELAIDLHAVADTTVVETPMLPLTPILARHAEELLSKFGEHKLGNNSNSVTPLHVLSTPPNDNAATTAAAISAFVAPPTTTTTCPVAPPDINLPSFSAPPVLMHTSVLQPPTPQNVPLTAPIVHAQALVPQSTTAAAAPPPPSIIHRSMTPLISQETPTAPFDMVQTQERPPAPPLGKGKDGVAWGVALAKLNAQRSAEASWEQEVREKRPAFGTTRDREERRKETNRKSAKVSRLRWRAYLVELEKVLVDGERNTQKLKREVVQIDAEQKELEATLMQLRQQQALRRNQQQHQHPLCAPPPVF